MLLYRIAEEQFARDMSGDGARIYGGRWNSKGVPLIYTSESVALAALEVLVRISTPKHFYRVIYQIPDNVGVETILVTELPQNWLIPHPNTHLIEAGKKWAQEKRSLLLKVPSAVVLGEGFNYLINPLHPEFSTVTIEDVSPFGYDFRLFEKR
jgi:RES domain-containing protein